MCCPQTGLSQAALLAIKAHAPERTGKQPESEIERYLFACDELSGFMHAVSLMRPDGFTGMKAKSVTKKAERQEVRCQCEPRRYFPRRRTHRGRPQRPY